MNFRKTKKSCIKKFLLSLALFSLLVDHNVKVKRKKKFYRKKILFCYSSIKNGEKVYQKREKESFIVRLVRLSFIDVTILSTWEWFRWKKLSRLLNGSAKAMDSSSKWLVPKFFNYSSTNSSNSLGSKIVLLRWRDFVTLYFHRYHQRRH